MLPLHAHLVVWQMTCMITHYYAILKYAYSMNYQLSRFQFKVDKGRNNYFSLAKISTGVPKGETAL
jgi:hypothetical protein